MPAKSLEALRRFARAEDAGPSGHKIPENPAAVHKYKGAFRSYRFRHAHRLGIIEVLNENSYVMAEYNERTGSMRWQRVVAASERDLVENWLKDHSPAA